MVSTYGQSVGNTSQTHDQANARFTPPAPAVPESVTTFQSSVAADMATLRGGVPLFAATLRTLRAALQAISSNTDASGAKMWRDSQAAKDTARAALSATMDRLQTTLVRVRAAALAAQALPISSDAVVSELAFANAMTFVREVFQGAGRGVGQAEINQLVQLGLPGMGQAIRTYIPIHVGNVAGGDTTLQQSLAAMLNTVLDVAIKPTEAAVYSAARDLLAELADGESRLKIAYQMATTEAQADIATRSGYRNLPDWGKNGLVQIFPQMP